jgi:hypothetical protein
MSKSTKIKILGIIIALLLITMALVYPVRADTARSVFDGEWTIKFTDCGGATTVYEYCVVNNINDTFVTFSAGGRSREIKLPLTSVCAMIIMERER